ncbi:Uma2 family endonuclease [Methylobacterium iners]|uniref:Putative restriction endonuclease domain-containing protein n=1 Tax=Methylobacterium iners TaxID=418707 RepID=A0ABQ4S3D4_9HYPH|nr:Uma2 family endonuclease [Methylobacterium iners]GJD96195.1 hypothetical protein OCOJLMKI_3414 [Methylobacterium iners]
MTASLTKDRPRDAHLRFQDFVASRPDEEKWELIDGRFIMQAQPNIDHQLIAGNLDRLLNDALERFGADRVAVQNPAIDLRPTVDNHTYVPDVAVLDSSEIVPGLNIMQTCYLAAEIISANDRRKPSGAAREKIAIKVENYEALPACEVILLIEQASFDVTVAVREGDLWVRHRLTSLDERVVLPTIGLDCALADLYARTSLMRARKAPAQ